eukprot:23567_1
MQLLYGTGSLQRGAVFHKRVPLGSLGVLIANYLRADYISRPTSPLLELRRRHVEVQVANHDLVRVLQGLFPLQRPFPPPSQGFPASLASSHMAHSQRETERSWNGHNAHHN